MQEQTINRSVMVIYFIINVILSQRLFHYIFQKRRIITVQRSARKKNNLPGMESCVAPLTILKGHQTTSRETADHSANSPKLPWLSVQTIASLFSRDLDTPWKFCCLLVRCSAWVCDLLTKWLESRFLQDSFPGRSFPFDTGRSQNCNLQSGPQEHVNNKKNRHCKRVHEFLHSAGTAIIWFRRNQVFFCAADHRTAPFTSDGIYFPYDSVDGIIRFCYP